MESSDTNEYGFELEFNSQLLQETSRSRTVTVTFKDKDPGDQFLVKVRADELLNRGFGSEEPALPWRGLMRCASSPEPHG